MHISEAVFEELAKRGWRINNLSATKQFFGYGEAGTISNGNRFLGVQFDSTGRWLTHYSGFDIAFELDSRDYFNEPVQFADDIEAKVLSLKSA